MTLWFGGPILTMDKANPRCEAILTDNGRITAVGNLAELSAMAPDAQKENLCGRTLMPGFVDGHSHLLSVGIALQKCNLSGCRSFAELLDRIRAFREKNGLTHGEVMICRGYDPTELEEGRHPDARLLDNLGFDNPICCEHISGHMAVFNTRAMEFCQVDDSFTCAIGGYAAKDERGHLTGYFEESAARPLKAKMYAAVDYNTEKAVLDAQQLYLSHGITTAQHGSAAGPEVLAELQEVADSGKLKLDLVTYAAADSWQQAKEICCPGQYKNRLKLGGVKLILDGAIPARCAWMKDPYEGEEAYCGYPKMEDAQVRKLLDMAVGFGAQPLAHCNGDAACQQFLDAWECAVKKHGHGQELRPIMIHAQTVTVEQLDRMPALGMHPSFFVGHCWYWGDVHLKNLGQRGMAISPVKAALDRGLVPNLHQDTPVTPPDMLHSVWCAVNRTTKGGLQLDKAYAVTPYEALIAVTNGAAFSYFEEDTKGILKPGAAADLVVLSHDPTEAEDIRAVQVLKTIKDGSVVFCR